MLMKKIFYLIFLITIFSKVHAYEYCDKSLKTLDPMGDKSPMTAILLVGELECLGKTKEAKEFKELTNENFKKTIAESMPQYPKGSQKKWRECGAKFIGENDQNLSDPVLQKKYHECETKRIDKLYDDHVIYSINLFYRLSGI